MASNRWGIHAANGEPGPKFSVGDYEVMLGMGVSNLTVLHMQSWQIPAWIHLYPDGMVHVRFYVENWMDWKAAEWATYCFNIARNPLVAPGFVKHLPGPWGKSLLELPQVVFSFANEQNLAVECGYRNPSHEDQLRCTSREHYQKINDWNLAVVREFCRLAGWPLGHRCVWASFAHGHSDDQADRYDTKGGIIGIHICRAAIRAHQYYAVHPYWYEADQMTSMWHGHRFVLARAIFEEWGKADPAFKDKPMIASESGNFNPLRESSPWEIITHANSLPPYMRMVSYFMFRDPTGHHWQNDWGRNKEIERQVKLAYKREVYMFVLGFATFAEALRKRGVDPGDPLMAEEPYVPSKGGTDALTVQHTTKGTMCWVKSANDMFWIGRDRRVVAFNGGNLKVA